MTATKLKTRRFHLWMLRVSTAKLVVLKKALVFFVDRNEASLEEQEDAGHLLRDCQTVLAKRTRTGKEPA